MRRTHPEHISSALPPIADVREPWRDFTFVPHPDSRIAASDARF
jgi:hypothetical protein